MAEGKNSRLSPQGYYYLGGFGLLGEYVLTHHHVRTANTSADLAHHAWQVVGSYVFGGRNSYEGVTVQNPLAVDKGTWGALEIAARYNELRVDDQTFPLYADAAKSARSAKGFALGLNWYLNRGIRINVNYEQTGFKGGNAGGTDRKTERVVFTRLQSAF